ncbi:MAG: hypothetical protein D6717_12335 [Gammaproteobacteria bacterium]|nr:MAG: hypothetical protein D6717_12335 [Gammaproteobacteria bacterium]
MNIPGYRIERELGSGGMSRVYLAVQEELDRPVALKVMAPALVADPVFAERFLTEARTIAGLRHPHIITAYDIGRTGSHTYMALEYASGGDLRGRIQAGMTEEQVTTVLRQVAEALAYAHGRGFVHRDIKPENILFEQDRALLTDFGIARAMGEERRLTGTGLSIGTPHYMSPEQARGEAVDGRSDLYSLGVVLYEMLTGDVPFDGRDPFAIAYRHIHDARPQLPSNLEDWQPLLDRLLAVDPARRFADAGQLLAALDGGTVPQTPARKETGGSARQATQVLTAADSARASGRRGRSLLWPVLLVLLAGAGTGGFVLWQQARTPRLAVGGSAMPPGDVKKEAPAPQPVRPPTVRSEPSTGPVAADELAAKLAGGGQEGRGTAVEKRLAKAGSNPDWEPDDPVQPREGARSRKKPAKTARQPDGFSGKDAVESQAGQTVSGGGKKADTGRQSESRAEAPVQTTPVARQPSAKIAAEAPAPEKQSRVAPTVEPGPVAVGRPFRDLLANGADGPEMIVLPAGRFLMGDSSGRGSARERPVHEVVLPRPFALSTHEVTFAEFDRFCRANRLPRLPDFGWGRGRHPAVNVPWDLAQAYADWLKRETGKPYRLPSEAEWEYAVRAGRSDGDVGEARKGRGLANCNNCGSRWDNRGTAPVGSFAANPFGLYDMQGNVWEWCADNDHPDYSGAPTDGRAWLGSSERHILRGGSWDYGRDALRFAARPDFGPNRVYSSVGIRLARDLSDEEMKKIFR